MPVYRMGTGFVHIKMTNTKKRPAPAPCCARIPSNEAGKADMRCRAISIFLCDWPTEDGGTCDGPLCAEHARRVGEDRHHCPRHPLV